MVLLTYDNIDFNRTVQGISDFTRDHRRALDALVADSSAILDDNTLLELERMMRRGVHVYIIKGVKEEADARLRYNGLGSKSDEGKEKVRGFLATLEAQGHVLDIKTRGPAGHQLLEIENYSILHKLSDCQSKAVAEMLLLDRFSLLYRNLVVIHRECEKRRTPYHILAARTICERRDVHSESPLLRNVYVSLQNMVEEIESDLLLGALEQQLKQTNTELLDSLDYFSYLREEKDGIKKDRNAIVRSLLDKMVPATLSRIQKGLTMEQAYAKYKRENRNKSSTDRKIVLATYGPLPVLGYDPRRIGLITRDKDIHELLVLRQYTAINYKEYRERRR